MMKSLLLLAAASVGCAATAYQPKGSAGGFSSSRLQENVFRVTFSGNGYTSVERATDFALLRAAEIALKNRFAFFEILSSEGGATTSFTLTRNFFGASVETIEKPRVTVTIACHKEKPSDSVYGAHYLANSIIKKYDLAIAPPAKPKKVTRTATKQTKSKVRAALDASADRFGRCITAAKQSGELQEGKHKVILNWVVLPDGTIETPSTKIRGVDKKSQLISCLDNAVMQLRFTPTKRRLEVTDYVWRTLEVDPPKPSKCELCSTSCKAETEQCNAGVVVSCYAVAVCLCRCRLTAGGCGEDLDTLAACIEKNNERIGSARRTDGERER